MHTALSALWLAHSSHRQTPGTALDVTRQKWLCVCGDELGQLVIDNLAVQIQQATHHRQSGGADSAASEAEG